MSTKIILTQIITFNRRREGEVSRIKLKEFNSTIQAGEESDLIKELPKKEQALCKLFTRIEILGKGDRIVPILLTPGTVKTIELLVKLRTKVGVAEDNPYLFAVMDRGSLLHYRGNDCLSKFAEQCGAKCPKSIRSTKLRKHVASLSQILNLKANELDCLAKFMGHDINIHREYYRLPDEVMETAKLSKIFLSLEKGLLPSQMGKTLEEIEIEEDLCTESSDEEELTSERTTESRVSFRPKRNAWSNAEKNAVEKNLGCFILRKKLPGKKEIEEVLDKEPALKNRTWKNIKDYVRNRIHSNGK